MKRERAKEEDVQNIIFDHLPLTKDAAFMVLTKCSIESAMDFNIAMAKDPRFIKLREVMKDNLIWNFWVKRDMGVIYMNDWTSETVLWRVIDKPMWKVYYLWLRMYVSYMQFAVIEWYNTWIIGSTHPKLKFYELNLFQDLTTEEFLDTRRDFYTKYGSQNWRTSTYENVFNSFRFANGFAGNSLKSELESIHTFLYGLRVKHGNSISEFPRHKQLEDEPIIIACSVCDKLAQFVEETNEKRPFCSESCQIKMF